MNGVRPMGMGTRPVSGAGPRPRAGCQTKRSEDPGVRLVAGRPGVVSSKCDPEGGAIESYIYTVLQRDYEGIHQRDPEGVVRGRTE